MSFPPPVPQEGEPPALGGNADPCFFPPPRQEKRGRRRLDSGRKARGGRIHPPFYKKELRKNRASFFSREKKKKGLRTPSPCKRKEGDRKDFPITSRDRKDDLPFLYKKGGKKTSRQNPGPPGGTQTLIPRPKKGEKKTSLPPPPIIRKNKAAATGCPPPVCSLPRV